MAFQNNRPVDILAIIEKRRQYERYAGQAVQPNGEGQIVSQTTAIRVIQESVDSVIRNIGTILAK